MQRAQGALEAALVAVRVSVELGGEGDVDDVVGLLVVDPTHHDRLEEAGRRGRQGGLGGGEQMKHADKTGFKESTQRGRHTTYVYVQQTDR